MNNSKVERYAEPEIQETAGRKRLQEATVMYRSGSVRAPSMASRTMTIKTRKQEIKLGDAVKFSRAEEQKLEAHGLSWTQGLFLIGPIRFAAQLAGFLPLTFQSCSSSVVSRSTLQRALSWSYTFWLLCCLVFRLVLAVQRDYKYNVEAVSNTMIYVLSIGSMYIGINLYSRGKLLLLAIESIHKQDHAYRLFSVDKVGADEVNPEIEEALNRGHVQRGQLDLIDLARAHVIHSQHPLFQNAELRKAAGVVPENEDETKEIVRISSTHLFNACILTLAPWLLANTTNLSDLVQGVSSEAKLSVIDSSLHDALGGFYTFMLLYISFVTLLVPVVVAMSMSLVIHAIYRRIKLLLQRVEDIEDSDSLSFLTYCVQVRNNINDHFLQVESYLLRPLAVGGLLMVVAVAIELCVMVDAKGKHPNITQYATPAIFYTAVAVLYAVRSKLLRLHARMHVELVRVVDMRNQHEARLKTQERIQRQQARFQQFRKTTKKGKASATDADHSREKDQATDAPDEEVKRREEESDALNGEEGSDSDSDSSESSASSGDGQQSGEERDSQAATQAWAQATFAPVRAGIGFDSVSHYKQLWSIMMRLLQTSMFVAVIMLVCLVVLQTALFPACTVVEPGVIHRGSVFDSDCTFNTRKLRITADILLRELPYSLATFVWCLFFHGWRTVKRTVPFVIGTSVVVVGVGSLGFIGEHNNSQTISWVLQLHFLASIIYLPYACAGILDEEYALQAGDHEQSPHGHHGQHGHSTGQSAHGHAPVSSSVQLSTVHVTVDRHGTGSGAVAKDAGGTDHSNDSAESRGSDPQTNSSGDDGASGEKAGPAAPTMTLPDLDDTDDEHSHTDDTETETETGTGTAKTVALPEHTSSENLQPKARKQSISLEHLETAKHKNRYQMHQQTTLHTKGHDSVEAMANAGLVVTGDEPRVRNAGAMSLPGVGVTEEHEDGHGHGHGHDEGNAVGRVAYTKAFFAMSIMLGFIRLVQGDLLVPFYEQATDNERLLVILILHPGLSTFVGWATEELATKIWNFKYVRDVTAVMIVPQVMVSLAGRLYLTGIDSVTKQIKSAVFLGLVEVAQRACYPIRMFLLELFLCSGVDKAIHISEHHRISEVSRQNVYIRMFAEFGSIVIAPLYSIYVRWYYDLPAFSYLPMFISMFAQLLVELGVDILACSIEQVYLGRGVMGLWSKMQRANTFLIAHAFVGPFVIAFVIRDFFVIVHSSVEE